MLYFFREFRLYKIKDNIDNAVRVNTDEIVQRIGHWSNIKNQMAAGKEAVKMMDNAMKNGLSINQETTLCGSGVKNKISHWLIQLSRRSF